MKAIGIIGLGVIGQRMLANTLDHPRLRVAAAWDPAAPAMTATGDAYPAVALVENAAAVIGHPEVDLVYVACPPLAHKGHALAAIAAGKPVLCEKPLAIDLASGREMANAAKASGLLNIVNFVHASGAGAGALAKLLRDGTLGDIQRIDLHLRFSLWPRSWQAPADWLRFRDQGGFVREVVSHYVYLTRRLFGDLAIDWAKPDWPADDKLCETSFQAHLTAGGAPWLIDSASGGTGPDEVVYTVWGSKGSARLVDWFTLFTSDGGPWQPAPGTPADPRQAALLAQVDHLADAVEGKPYSMASFADALAVQELVEAVLAG
jgi:predicted dehydrogenase